jgi:hypothetical protein
MMTMNVNKETRIDLDWNTAGSVPAVLNESYYHDLISKYALQQDGNKATYLTFSMILNNYKKKNIYFSFPASYELQKIINLLYEYLSKQIFINYANSTDYSIGDRLKRTNEKRENTYSITEITGSVYILTKEKDINNTKLQATFNSLKRNYVKIQQPVKNSTLLNYKNHFKNINKYGSLPTHFTKKLVLIAGQTIWNDLSNRNCIPSIYLPNTRESEQTTKRSIEALEDCITYVTSRYEVCYESILKKGISVDTIVACNTDLGTLPQIISDQLKYHFKLIVISSESGVQRFNNINLWKWQKEEIELLEEKTINNIEIEYIEDKEFDTLLQHFEECKQYVSSLEIPINLKDYGYFLHLALKALQDKQFDYLLMRLKNNQKLERNEGGYADFADKNPKESLETLIHYLKTSNLKRDRLSNTIKEATKSIIVIAEREDVDFLKSVKNSNCEIITNTELKKRLKEGATYTKTIVVYSFDGTRDFNFIYNLPTKVQFVLYKQEKDLYCKQLQSHTAQLETELTNESRLAICGVKYKPIPAPEIKINPTLEQIIERLEQRSNAAYDGYKNESDSLLDDLEEEITFKITMSNGNTWEMQSNETVFNTNGDLIKSYRLKVGDKVRLYPKEQLAENLLQIAIEEEPEIYGKIEEHATIWQNALKNMEQKYDREQLYKRLKERGLKVVTKTVDDYFRGKVKFPGYYPDLKLILTLNNQIEIYTAVKKSKHLYNSTMIALNRGVKQEIQQFLKDKTLGEILQKKNFTADTLQKFIDNDMPLLTITKIEEVNDEQQ